MSSSSSVAARYRPYECDQRYEDDPRKYKGIEDFTYHPMGARFFSPLLSFVLALLVFGLLIAISSMGIHTVAKLENNDDVGESYRTWTNILSFTGIGLGLVLFGFTGSTIGLTNTQVFKLSLVVFCFFVVMLCCAMTVESVLNSRTKGEPAWLYQMVPLVTVITAVSGAGLVGLSNKITFWQEKMESYKELPSSGVGGGGGPPPKPVKQDPFATTPFELAERINNT